MIHHMKYIFMRHNMEHWTYITEINIVQCDNCI